MATKIFVNLPVRDLQKSVEFFTKLGFAFNAQFTDENATCMIINEESYVMLLTEQFFQGFITKQISDTSKYAEVILAISQDSKEQVDEMAKKAKEAGAMVLEEAKDYGFMYQRNFQDLDGHLWEVFWMDPNHVQES